MDDRLTEAFWHVRHRVYGRTLRPLTLRHCFVLATADNPLITGGRVATTADLLQAVEICSRPSGFFLAGHRPSWIARQYTALRSVFGRDGIPEFVAYLEDYCTGPSVWRSQNAKGARAHWVISTVAGLCYWLKMPLEQAWEMSPGAASWLIAAAIEQSPHASIDLLSEDEQRVIDMIRAQEKGGEG